MTEPWEIREQERRDKQVHMCDMCFSHYLEEDCTHVDGVGWVCYLCVKKLEDDQA